MFSLYTPQRRNEWKGAFGLSSWVHRYLALPWHCRMHGHTGHFIQGQVSGQEVGWNQRAFSLWVEVEWERLFLCWLWYAAFSLLKIKSLVEWWSPDCTFARCNPADVCLIGQGSCLLFTTEDLAHQTVSGRHITGTQRIAGKWCNEGMQTSLWKSLTWILSIAS